MDRLENELKKEFQLERLILFSDAVFAIAITILILEIKVPELEGDISDDVILHALVKLIPKFIGFLISFFLIGQYWAGHHRMFGFVTSYNRKLLWMNLYFLLTIVVMPFTTGLYSEYSGTIMFQKQLKVPMTFYVGNIVLTAFANYRLWSYITNPKNHLAEHLPSRNFIKMVKWRAAILPFCFLIMLPIAYGFGVQYAVYVPMLIPILIALVRKRYDKKT